MKKGSFSKFVYHTKLREWEQSVWRTRQLFTRARMDWSNRLTRTLWSSKKASRKSCTCTIINTCTSTVWGRTIWKTVLQKNYLSSWWTLSWTWAMCNCTNESQQLAAFCQCVKRRATKVLKDGMQDLWNWGNVFIQRLRIDLIALHNWIENREKMEPDSSWRNMEVEWDAMYTSWNRLK